MRYVAHGYFAYVNEISFAYLEHLVHGGVAQYCLLDLCFFPTGRNENPVHVSVRANCLVRDNQTLAAAG